MDSGSESGFSNSGFSSLDDGEDPNDADVRKMSTMRGDARNRRQGENPQGANKTDRQMTYALGKQNKVMEDMAKTMAAALEKPAGSMLDKTLFVKEIEAVEKLIELGFATQRTSRA